MVSHNEKPNITLSKLDKFRLFEIKHKGVEYVATFSTFIMPFCASLFAIGEFAIGIGLLYWWILSFDNAICLTVATIIHWIIGIVLGVLGDAPSLIWFIYFPLFMNTIYYLICELLEEQECKKGETSLEILYKQHNIK